MTKQRIKEYVVYEFIDDECQGNDYVTTFEEAKRIAMDLYNNGSDVVIYGVDYEDNEIDLGDRGNYTHEKEDDDE